MTNNYLEEAISLLLVRQFACENAVGSNPEALE